MVTLTMRTFPAVRQAVDRAPCLNSQRVWKTNSMMEELTVADKSRLAKCCLLPDPIRCAEPVVHLLDKRINDYPGLRDEAPVVGGNHPAVQRSSKALEGGVIILFEIFRHLFFAQNIGLVACLLASFKVSNKGHLLPVLVATS